MNVIIVDDELSVRNTITKLLTEQFPDIKIISSVGTINAGYEAILQHAPELLFLDVELPDGTGFDLLKMVSPVNFKVIFITGHQEYALDAIKVSALDYILKPFDTDELRSAVEKAKEVINHEEEQLKLQALNENLQGKKQLKRIILPTSEHLHIVSISDIIRAEADSNYTTFWLTVGKKIMVSRTIKEYEGMLSGSGLIRVHQSHLVNINHIDRFVKRDGGYLQLKDGTNIPVSVNLKKQVVQAIKDHMYE
ncbi:MAG TPA: LytTR family DNA-binding domain-containing protein [Bacteroidales bacterium]|nr:LytTR family DNA-binding domain-containing protein [Bacteroidales bacterium]